MGFTVILITMKDDTKMDYHKLNDVMHKDAFPLPHINNMPQRFFDLKSGYWQVVLDQADRQKMASVICQGLHQFKVLLFGLCNAPAVFECLMIKVCMNYNRRPVSSTWTICLIFGPTVEAAIHNLKEVFSHVHDTGLNLSPKKFSSIQMEVSFLGHILSGE